MPPPPAPSPKKSPCCAKSQCPCTPPPTRTYPATPNSPPSSRHLLRPSGSPNFPSFRRLCQNEGKLLVYNVLFLQNAYVPGMKEKWSDLCLELSSDQLRTVVDTQQLFQAWSEA